MDVAVNLLVKYFRWLLSAWNRLSCLRVFSSRHLTKNGLFCRPLRSTNCSTGKNFHIAFEISPTTTSMRLSLLACLTLLWSFMSFMSVTVDAFFGWVICIFLIFLVFVRFPANPCHFRLRSYITKPAIELFVRYIFLESLLHLRLVCWINEFYSVICCDLFIFISN